MTKVLVIKSIESEVASEVADGLLTKFTAQAMTQFDVVESPSVTEIPAIVSMSLESSSYECVICLGVVCEDAKNPINSQSNFKNVAGILSDFSTHYILPIGSGVAYCATEEDVNKVATRYFSKAIENTLKLLSVKHRISLLEDDEFKPQRKHN